MNGKKTNIHFFPLLFNQNGLTFPSAWLNLIQASSRLSALDLCFSQSIYFRRLAIVNSFYIPLKCKSSQPPASFTTQKCLFQGLENHLFEISSSKKIASLSPSLYGKVEVYFWWDKGQLANTNDLIIFVNWPAPQ